MALGGNHLEINELKLSKREKSTATICGKELNR